MSRLRKRIVQRPKPPAYAPAEDARARRRKTDGDLALSLASACFSMIYHSAQRAFFLGCGLALLQFAYQTYAYATTRQWPACSSLKALQTLRLAPAAAWDNALDLVSGGVALLGIAFALMVVAQLFIKDSSR